MAVFRTHSRCVHISLTPADSLFERLPKDVLGYMVAMLPFDAMQSFARTCRAGAAAVRSDAHWHRRHAVRSASCTYSLTHSLARSLTHSLAHSLTHSLTLYCFVRLYLTRQVEFGEPSVQPAPGTSWLDIYKPRYYERLIPVEIPLPSKLFMLCDVLPPQPSRCSSLRIGPH